LFQNRQSPAKDNESKKKWVDGFHWKRASEFYGDGNYKIFDGVDPSDIIMGSCNDCYLFAALAGIAESTNDENGEHEKGQRIMDNFLTQKVNSSGCYAI
jgi:hypothetical protein